jgi:hypothetical protein
MRPVSQRSALGKEPPEAIAELCALNRSEEGAALRSRVALLGDRWIAEARGHDLRGDLDRERHMRGETDEAYAGI